MTKKNEDKENPDADVNAAIAAAASQFPVLVSSSISPTESAAEDRRRWRAEEYLRIHLQAWHDKREGQPLSPQQFPMFVPSMAALAVALADQLEHELGKEPGPVAIDDPTLGAP